MKKVVLAYSGGLDTSCIVKWLTDQGWGVVCFVADLGQGLGKGESLSAIEKRATAAGALKVYIKDLQKEFLEDFVVPALKAGAVYEGKYLLATALGRPLIAKHLVATADGFAREGHANTARRDDDCRSAGKNSQATRVWLRENRFRRIANGRSGRVRQFRRRA